MNSSSQEQFSETVRNNYDHLSKVYDLISGSTERKLIKQTIQQLDMPAGVSCLEIGCGTGTGLLELTDKFPRANKIVGIDISLGMCQKAKIKVDRTKSVNSPMVFQANGFSLPFQSSLFDLVFMSFTFELIPQQLYQSLCSEILRSLKPAGIFSTLSIMASETKNPIFTLYKWGHTLFPKLIDCRPIDSPAILTSFGFTILSTQSYDLWGIPVATTTALKEKA